jgi:hypothetical protein
MPPKKKADPGETARLLESLTAQQQARLNQFMAITKIEDMHEAYRMLEICD